jgi:hypothetical protein
MAVIEAIATQYLEADAASVTFSGIPATYEHLQLRGSVKGGRSGSTNNTMVTLNGDTGTNYSNHSMFASASTAYASGYTGLSGFFTYYNTTPSVTNNASSYATFVMDILDYRNANKNTTVACLWGAWLDTYWYLYNTSGLWDDTAAVTSVTVIMNPTYDTVRGSEFTLYGLNSS